MNIFTAQSLNTYCLERSFVWPLRPEGVHIPTFTYCFHFPHRIFLKCSDKITFCLVLSLETATTVCKVKYTAFYYILY